MGHPTALELIDDVMRRVRPEGEPSLQATRIYLETLRARITQEQEHGSRASPHYESSTELAESIFLYTHVVCDYFRRLKRVRPLTNDEIYIGGQLNDLLRRTMVSLATAPSPGPRP